MRVDTIRLQDTQGWRIQIRKEVGAVAENKSYLVSGRMKADRARQASLSVMDSASPPGSLGAEKPLALDSEWAPIQFKFTALRSDPNASIVVRIGGSDIPVEVADLKLTPE